MPLGNKYLTDLSKEQAETQPGMAHWAGTGPRGKTCGQCVFKGFSYPGREVTNARTGNTHTVMHRSNGCEKFYKMMRKVGADLPDKSFSCKYFEQRTR